MPLLNVAAILGTDLKTAKTLLSISASIHQPTYTIPVSYTHLDVYKRQDQNKPSLV